VKREIPGPRSRAILERERPNLAPGIQSISTLAGIAIDRGEGAHLIDADGNSYLDFVAGICVSSIGHGHPALAEALGRQASRVTATSFACEERAELLERIAQVAGRLGAGNLRRTQLYSGGAEAVESALRLARAYTKRYEVLSFWGGYHGKTGGVVGLMGSEFKRGLGPSTFVPGLHLAPFPDPFRSPLDGNARVAPADQPAMTQRYLGYLRDKLRLESDGQLAAIIVEPIQGTAGNVIPPPGFLRGLRELSRELGCLLVLDEMITGWGRTGRLFGQEHEPEADCDIFTFGKGVGNGFPVTGLVTTDEIADPKSCDPWGRPSFSSSSYGGSPLAAAAANAVTRVVVEQKLDEHAARVGAHFLRGLERLQQKHEVIGEVRGRGLLIAVELVADRKTMAPLPKPRCEQLFRLCLERGLLTMAYSPRVRINPPLVITQAEVDEGLAILDDALGALARE
jgi:4-aminobutyrate aminotransferase / (S)-3-amino-2-methylpropionate transaminase / 5-aminovalerate transaminase